MMEPLVTAIFLLLLSGTTMSKEPNNLGHSQCDSLAYRDMALIYSGAEHNLFTNKAFFNNELVYKYDSESQTAKPQPGWENVENWGEISKLQKERGDFALENVELIKKTFGYRDDYNLTGIYGCDVCKNNVIKVRWTYYDSDKPLITFDTNGPTWKALSREGKILKKKWEEDPSAPNRAKSYLEEDCPKKLQEYKNYKNTN
ncbi:zinc-alpha-2-glycoprotein-like [Monodelphis domestica]|uniref:zinc-alpha-2-glycoprotein-like n=1 Tax=Monodelphis domestica TaxID=13616 RepID=UPI0024E1DD19|nr:zinc-alpha-2-glycoprotein-like [Monodelphis domestica]